METAVITPEAELEKKEILNRYRGLLRSCRYKLDDADKKLIRKAFNIALEAHKKCKAQIGRAVYISPFSCCAYCCRRNRAWRHSYCLRLAARYGGRYRYYAERY